VLGIAGSRPSYLRGVARDVNGGGWQADQLAAQAPTVVCMVTCPKAVASTSSLSQEAIVPQLLGGATAADLTEQARTSVLAATGGALVQQTLTGDGTRLTVGAGSTPLFFDVPGGDTTWRQTNDNRVALALSSAKNGTYAARAFRRDGKSWHQIGSTRRSTTLFGCVDEGAEHLVVTDPKPNLIDITRGLTVEIPGLEAGGDCGFTEEAVVVAQYSASGGASKTDLVTAGLDGRVRSRQSFPFEVRIRTQVNGSHYLVLQESGAWENDSSGAHLRTVDNVADARYDEQGDLVTVSPTGDVRWLSATEG
jgi:hypothetical protein